MPQRLICNCGFILERPTHYCLNCGKKYALGCGVYVSSKKLYIFFVGKVENETLAIKRYSEDVSLRNLYEIAAERIYERRVEEIIISGENDDLIVEACEALKNSLYPFKIVRTDYFDNFSDFSKELEKFIKLKSKLKKVFLSPEKKIHGSHSTIIGGREGFALLLKLASTPYVKKIVPGVIENKGVASGGSRLKLTRCDEKGNIKALLIDGATVQQIHVITTASNKEEGERILKILKIEVPS